MQEIFSETEYESMLSKLFVRFPSFQKVGAGAYKPGIGNMEFFDQLAGHPHRKYKVIHVAGTNGKGSVSNMLASALASQGLKVGLYTSPHIIDFRERIRMVSSRPECDGESFSLIPKEYRDRSDEPEDGLRGRPDREENGQERDEQEAHGHLRPSAYRSARRF